MHTPQSFHQSPKESSESVTLNLGFVEFAGQEYPFFGQYIAARRMRGPTADPAITQREEQAERLPVAVTESILTGIEAGFPLVFMGPQKGLQHVRGDLGLIAGKLGLLYRGRIDGAVRNKDLLALLRRAYAPFADEAYTSKENRAAFQKIEEEYLAVSGRETLAVDITPTDEMSYLKAKQAKDAVMDKELRTKRDERQKILYVIENFSALSRQEQYLLLQMVEPDPAGSLSHLYHKAPKPALVILQEYTKPLPESLEGNRAVLFTGYREKTIAETAILSEPQTEVHQLDMTDPLLYRHAGMVAMHDAFLVLEERASTPLEMSLLVKVRQMLLSYAAWNSDAGSEELLGLWAERLAYLAQAPTKKRTREQTEILERLLRETQVHVGRLPKVIKSLRKKLEKVGLSLENQEQHGGIGQYYHAKIHALLRPQGLSKVTAKYAPWMSDQTESIHELRTLVHQGYTEILAEAFRGVDLALDYTKQTDQQTTWQLSRIRSVLGMFDKTALLRSHVGTVEARERVEQLRKKLRFTFQQHHGRLRPNYRLDESEQMLEERRREQLATLPDIVEYLGLHFSVLQNSAGETNAEIRDMLRNIFAELRDDIAPLETLCDLGDEKRPSHPKSGEALPPIYAKSNLHIGFANRAAPELRAHVLMLPTPDSSLHGWDVWGTWIEPEFAKGDAFPKGMTEEERQTFKNNLSAHIDIATLYFASMVGDTSLATEVQRRSYLHTPEEIFSFVSESWNPVLKVINDRRLRSDLGPLPHFPVSALLVQQIALAYEALLMLSYSGKKPYASIAAREAVSMFKQKHRNNDRMLGYVQGYLG